MLVTISRAGAQRSPWHIHVSAAIFQQGTFFLFLWYFMLKMLGREEDLPVVNKRAPLMYSSNFMDMMQDYPWIKLKK